MTNELIEQYLTQLKEARENSAAYKSAMREAVENVKQSDTYQVYETSARESDQAIEFFESELRRLALAEYEATKNKAPHPKIAVKIFKTFKILDAAKVRAWAFGNLPAALKLDEKKVEKYALEFGDVEGTEKGEEARAQIATEL